MTTTTETKNAPLIGVSCTELENTGEGGVLIAYCECGHHWYPRNPEKSRCPKCRAKTGIIFVRRIVSHRGSGSFFMRVYDPVADEPAADNFEYLIAGWGL